MKKRLRVLKVIMEESEYPGTPFLYHIEVRDKGRWVGGSSNMTSITETSNSVGNWINAKVKDVNFSEGIGKALIEKFSNVEEVAKKRITLWDRLKMAWSAFRCRP